MDRCLRKLLLLGRPLDSVDFMDGHKKKEKDKTESLEREEEKTRTHVRTHTHTQAKWRDPVGT